MLILRTLTEFAANGHGDAKPLKGEDCFRLRAGDWRIIFEESSESGIRILRVRNRREAYR
jgi:mRNA-degrading endonuclease RelE of RelBE toxin-antitoxin system